MRWTTSRDGKLRTTVRTEFRLSRDDLTEILAARAASYGLHRAGDLSAARVQEEIRQELAGHGMDTWPYWREHDHDKQAPEIMKWAERQAAKLAPPRK